MAAPGNRIQDNAQLEDHAVQGGHMVAHSQDERSKRADGHQVERDSQQWVIHRAYPSQVVARSDHHQHAQEGIDADQG